MKVLKKFSNYKNGGKTDDDKKNKKSSLPKNTIFTGEKKKVMHHGFSGKPTLDAKRIEVEKIIIDGKEYWYSPQYDVKREVKDLSKELPFPRPKPEDSESKQLTPEEKKKLLDEMFRFGPSKKSKTVNEKAKSKLREISELETGGTLMERYNKKLKNQ